MYQCVHVCTNVFTLICMSNLATYTMLVHLFSAIALLVKLNVLFVVVTPLIVGFVCSFDSGMVGLCLQ